MDNSKSVSNLDAILFALVLEVVLLQMQILESSTDLRISQWNTRDKIEKLQHEKLVRDRHMVKDAIRRTLVEIAECGEWSCLQEAVGCLVKRAFSATSKKLDHARLKISREAIANELASKRNQWLFELRSADQKVAFLRDKIRDDTLNSNTRLCYAEKWLCARAESLDLRCQAARESLPRADLEQRVHDELLKAYALQIEEREEALEYWRMRYSDDTAVINKRLAEKRDELQVSLARHAELQEVYDVHAGEMRGWLTFKRERAVRLAREERLRLAARRIQAWWRGVMVRRALGCFRFLRNAKKTPSKTKKK